MRPIETERPDDDQPSIDRLLAAAIERRRPHLQGRELTAFRWVNGTGDQAPPSLTIDRYGDWLVVGCRAGLEDFQIAPWLSACERMLGPKGIVLKRHAPQAGRGESLVVRGAAPPEGLVVAEEDARFGVVLDGGVQTGLFLDQRENRLWLRDFADQRTVLNLFAYTGAFSVHMALAGAARVTSVDVARSALRRARENFGRSGLAAEHHEWLVEDVGRVLRKSRKYDLIIADPPVLGRAGNKTFSLKRAQAALCAGMLARAAPGAVLYFSAHGRFVRNERVEADFRRAALEQGRRIRVLRTLGLPAWDHPTRVLERPAGRPGAGSGGPRADSGPGDRGDYLKGLVLEVD